MRVSIVIHCDHGRYHERLSLAAAASMLGLALVTSPMTDLQAAELKILAGGSMTGSLNELGPQFERASGHKLAIHFDSTPNLIKQVTSGAPFDLVVALAPAVAKGEADLGVFLVNVLIAPGVELAGPFPAELQQELVFTAAVAADSKEADAATAFITFLTTPAAAAVIKAKGMIPG